MSEPKLTEAEVALLDDAEGWVMDDGAHRNAAVEKILAVRLAPVEAEPHVVHVTAEPVAEDLVWCDECEEWVASGAPEPDSGLIAALRRKVADLSAERDYLRAAKATAAARGEVIARVRALRGRWYSDGRPWTAWAVSALDAALDGPAPQTYEAHRLVGEIGRQKCSCGWTPPLGESVTRAHDRHLLDMRPKGATCGVTRDGIACQELAGHAGQHRASYYRRFTNDGEEITPPTTDAEEATDHG